MIKSYLKIAWRNLLKHTGFSFINILGLATGIAACIIIFLYVHNELSFDQYNTNADRIARITMTLHAPESDVQVASTTAPLAGILKREYPEVAAAVRLESSPQILKLNNEPISEDAFYKTEQSIFSVFSFEFVEGGATGALQNEHTIVITASIAKKYFGNRPALGKILICSGQNTLVTGVIKDRPPNSDIQIDALLSHDFSTAKLWMDDFSVYTFILFNRATDRQQFTTKLAPIAVKYVQPELNARGDNKYKVSFQLEPLREVHFSKGKLLDTAKGNKQFNYIFSMLALFILVIALLNYINLSTAKSTERAKEVGIRKVSGAGRLQLIRQFIFESFFLITIAWSLAIILVVLSLPFFNHLLQTKLAIDWLQTMLFMAIIFLVTLILAGFYPAFVLSSFKPVNVLKGSWQHNSHGVLLRKTVTVIQFAIAAGLIMGTTVIYIQMKYIEKKDLGFNKEQLLNIYLPADSTAGTAVNIFQNELRQRPEVQALTIGCGMGATILSGTVAITAGKRREMMCMYYPVDEYFLSVFQMQLVEGRNFDTRFMTDKKEGFLVNEAFVKAMGWKSGIGNTIEGNGLKGKILGVVKNFFTQSLHNRVEPSVLNYNTSSANNTTTIKSSRATCPL